MESKYIDDLRELKANQTKAYDLSERRPIATCISKYLHTSTNLNEEGKPIRYTIRQNKSISIITVKRIS